VEDKYRKCVSALGMSVFLSSPLPWLAPSAFDPLDFC
jgi:hypothetical protein